MIYHIERVTLVREKEGFPAQIFAFATSNYVRDLKAHREALKRQYNANRVHMNYTMIPKDEADN